MVVLALRGSYLEGGSSTAIGDNEVREHDSFGARGADDVSDRACINLDIGESLTFLLVGVNDEADSSRSDCIVGEGVHFHLIASHMWYCPSMGD